MGKTPFTQGQNGQCNRNYFALSHNIGEKELHCRWAVTSQVSHVHVPNHVANVLYSNLLRAYTNAK